MEKRRTSESDDNERRTKRRRRAHSKNTNQIITNRQTYETWCILMPTHFAQFNHRTDITKRRISQCTIETVRYTSKFEVEWENDRDSKQLIAKKRTKQKWMVRVCDCIGQDDASQRWSDEEVATIRVVYCDTKAKQKAPNHNGSYKVMGNICNEIRWWWIHWRRTTTGQNNSKGTRQAIKQSLCVLQYNFFFFRNLYKTTTKYIYIL